MCTIDWDIVQKFTECLIWPIIVIVLILNFKNQITRFVDRITNESDSVEFGSVKFQLKQIQLIKEQTKKGNTPTIDQTEILISTTVQVQVESIKQLGKSYLSSSYHERRLLESKIKEYCIGLTIDDVIPLFSEKAQGSKIAAIFALQIIFDNNESDPYDNYTVRSFVENSLSNKISFIRYEALQIVLNSSKMKDKFRNILNKMMDSDSNSSIRGFLKIYNNKR